MIFEISYIEFREFIKEYSLIESQDKIWIISVIHNSRRLKYYRILNSQRITIGIGSVREDGSISEVSFVIHPNFKYTGYGRGFTEFSKIAFSNPYFIVSKFNKFGLTFFRKLDLDYWCIDESNDFIFKFPFK